MAAASAAADDRRLPAWPPSTCMRAPSTLRPAESRRRRGECDCAVGEGEEQNEGAQHVCV
eukprot:scaffold8812_cov63-Phaeocystis_antarctica.AAC.4